MSRRSTDTDYLFVGVDIECPKGHRVGEVFKFTGQHPRAGRYTVGQGVQFEDAPIPTETSGRIRGSCTKCGADVEARGDRLRDLLDANEARGRNTGKFRP